MKIEGRHFSNLRYADDTLLISSGPEELMELIRRLEDVIQEYGLKTNVNKTKIIIVDRNNEYQTQPVKIGIFEIVDRFRYLGSMLHKSGP